MMQIRGNFQKDWLCRFIAIAGRLIKSGAARRQQIGKMRLGLQIA